MTPAGECCFWLAAQICAVRSAALRHVRQLCRDHCPLAFIEMPAMQFDESGIDRLIDLARDLLGLGLIQRVGAEDVRVGLCDDWLAPAREIPPDTVLIPAFGREGTGMANALEALREAVGVLRDYLAAAMARADTADADRRAAESRALAAERRADAAEARAATLQTEVEAMRRADAARRARGRLARIRAAWRGE